MFSSQDVEGGCVVYFDSVLCWPRTPVATWAVLPCPDIFHGLEYDTTGNWTSLVSRNDWILTRRLLSSPLPFTDNATRYCHLNGMWDNYTNYDNCHHIADSNADFDPTVELPTYIYCLGYLLSLISLALAVFVFIRFKYVKSIVTIRSLSMHMEHLITDNP